MTTGLLFTSFMLGLRHGIDWDHIAAIADLTSSARSRRQGFVLSLWYAIGHAVVVFALGLAAVAFGASIPSTVDSWMGPIVGATLVALGIWVIVELARNGRNFRLRSRWMLILDGTFAGLRRVTGRGRMREIAVQHRHPHQHDHGDTHESARSHNHSHTDAVLDAAAKQVVPAIRSSRFEYRPWRHEHSHRHNLVVPSSATTGYGNGTAGGIGILHGIGVESPTQIAIFVASTSVAGSRVGVLILATWVTGLVVANAVLAAIASFGSLNPEKNFAVYATLAVLVALASIAMGSILLLGLDTLPAIEI